MKLPLPGLNKKEKTEYFLAALLRDDLIKAIVFEQINATMKVVGSHTEHFPTTLENAPIEEWIDTFDKAVGAIESTLPPNSLLKKTVFGVKQDWVEDAKIKKDYLTKLKKVSEELDLQPIGFLVFTEAIMHLLQKERGAPVSGILVEIGKAFITVSLLRAGKIIEVKNSPVTSELAVQTVEALLKQVTNAEILPSKIILFDGDNMDAVAQEFIKYPWNKNLPFLHVPQVEVLSPDFDTKAVMYGTSLQMGLQLVGDMPTPAPEAIPDAPSSIASTLPESNATVTAEETKTAIGKTNEPEPQEPSAIMQNAEHFGFITEKDAAEEAPPAEQQTTPESTIDISSSTQTPAASPDTVSQLAFDEPKPSLFTRLATLPFFKRSPSAMVNTPMQQTLPSLSRGKKLLLFLLPLLLLLAVGGTILYITEERATVILSVTPKIIDKSQDVTFSLKEDSNFSGNVIHASSITVSEDGSTSTAATGTKDTGSHAKGTITVFNSSSNAKSLSSGTTVVSANNIKYTLDKDITVASASGDIFTGTKPGTIDVTVTAADIGTDANLPSGTKFTIGNDASIAAKNDSAFSGGTKKQITVVSKSDIDLLLKNLTINLESKAKDDIVKNASSDKEVLPIILSSSVDKQKTDKNAGDETKTVTLNGTVTYTGMGYEKSELLNFVNTLLRDTFSKNPALSKKDIMSSVTNAAGKDATTVTATVKAEASLVPTLDTKKLAGEIKGKSSAQAKNIAMQAPQVAESTITLSPNIFFLPKMLPYFEKHITIIVRTK